MATKTFHPFPKLPAELRIYIWDLAIRPSRHTGGVHRFLPADKANHKRYPGSTFFEQKVEAEYLAVSCRAKSEQTDNPEAYISVPPIGEQQEVGQSIPKSVRNSAYFWDAGLWTACIESRDVMMKHFKNMKLATSDNSDYSCRCLDYSHVNYHQQTGRVQCSMHNVDFAIRGQEQCWSLVAHAHNDIFCFSPTVNQPVSPGKQRFSPLWSQNVIHWRFTVRYLALEFDPSWNLDVRKPLQEMVKQDGACSFIFRFITEREFDKNYGFIWLIDRKAPMPDTSSEVTPRRTFYDLDTEYVETTEREIVHAIGEGSFVEKYRTSSAMFHFMMGDIIASDVWIGASQPIFKINEWMGILACRDLK